MQVVGGMDVVRRVEAVAVDGSDRPVRPVTISDCGSEWPAIPFEVRRPSH